MTDIVKPISTESSVNTTPNAVSNTASLVRLMHTGASTVSNLVTCKTTQYFNANSGVSSNTISFLYGKNFFANGDTVTYLTDTGNTAISGLTNNTSYYILSASETGVKLAANLAALANGTPVALTANGTAGAGSNGHNLSKTNWTMTILGTIPVTVQKNTPIDTLTGTDTGTAVKAVAVAYTN
jgi:hypothetical protein